MNQTVCVLSVFGTRPELIKLAPILYELKSDPQITTVLVSTGQQPDLVPSFLNTFELQLDDDLGSMAEGQSLNRSVAKMIAALDETIERYAPDLMLVQGDTSSALAGAIAARFRAVPIVHVEAGLRTHDAMSPFPEESNRRLISHIASIHCAPTRGNVANLLDEGISNESIFCTGNPVVDALKSIDELATPSPHIRSVLERHEGKKIILFTMHRRENFGDRLVQYLQTVKEFIAQDSRFALIAPLHPNPAAKQVVQESLSGAPRVSLIDPLDYVDFIHLLKSAWLVLSDSGGVQEEIVTLGKPMLILRKHTERPEVVVIGSARIVATAEKLRAELNNARTPGSWIEDVVKHENPFGDGQSGRRIARIIRNFALRNESESDAPGD